MTGLRLERPAPEHEARYAEMMAEWMTFGGRMYPGAIRQGVKMPYAQWLCKLRDEENAHTCPPERVPSDVFFLLNDQGRLLGGVAVRHALNEHLLRVGGHIGYGIRPSERGKGLGKRQLRLALAYARDELHLERALITCDRSNPASAHVIIANGGALENEVTEEDGNVVQRYWIDLARR